MSTKLSPILSRQYHEIFVTKRYIDFGDNFRVLVTESLYWWHLLNASARRLCSKKEDAGDENGQNRHQNLKVFANTFRLQHPSSTSSRIAESNLGRVSYQEILSLSRDRYSLQVQSTIDKLSISTKETSLIVHWILSSIMWSKDFLINLDLILIEANQFCGACPVGVKLHFYRFNFDSFIICLNINISKLTTLYASWRIST